MLTRPLRKFLVLVLLAGASECIAVAQPLFPVPPDADRRKLEADLQRYGGPGELDSQRVSRCAKRSQAVVGVTPGALRRMCGPWQHQSFHSTPNGYVATLIYQVGSVTLLSVVVTGSLVSWAWAP